MTASSKTADALLARRTLFGVNMVAAILGGLSLVLAVSAPFNLGMSDWMSFADVMVAACLCGGLPLLCVASIVCSRWLLARGADAMAVVVAAVPLLLLLALLAWDLSNA